MNTHTFFKTTPLLALLLTFVLSSCGTSGVQSEGRGLDLNKDYEKIQIAMTYKSLATLDLDQMSDLLQEKLNEYAKQSNIQSLREATMIVFARPDEDGMVEKILSNVRNPLEEEGQWQSTIEALVRQSVETLKNSNARQTDQVTSGIVLENIVAEFKPTYIKQFKTGGFETDVVDFVANADVTYSKSASKERSLYLMRNNLNPTQIAQKIQASRQGLAEKEAKENKNKKK